VFGYLKVHGLNQYARAFVECGLSDLDAVARLSESEALDFLERLRVYPGHKLRLVRAIDVLRTAMLHAERRNAAQMLEDDAALNRLCAENEDLHKQKSSQQDENKRLQEENSRLIRVIRDQDAQLKTGKDKVGELEELVQSQTEQVNFLAQQLQMLAQAEPEKENQLYKSYRDSFFDDWGSAEKIQLPDQPETTTFPTPKDINSKAAGGGSEPMDKLRCFTPADFTPKVGIGGPSVASDAENVRSRHVVGISGSGQLPLRASPAPGSADRNGPTNSERNWSPPRSRLAQSLDYGQVKECLAGFDVEHITKCLSQAILNKIILTIHKPRPHLAKPERVKDCSIYLEPACLDKLLQEDSRDKLSEDTVELGAGRDFRASGSFNRPHDPLNSIAVRSVPHRWDVFGFLRDVMMNFRLEPEVSIVTLFYLDRFTELSGVAMTPDNWQRLTISAMMLASKVWNDESFENFEFAQLCPLYTLDEINTFERIFLKSVGYNMSVKGSEYAKTYFLLRTLGAKDAADFGIEPINPQRASRLLERCLEKQVEFKERQHGIVEADDMNWTM